MNILVLVESPRKIRHVEHHLMALKDGNHYTVKATLGHITELASVGPYKIGVEDFNTMEEQYDVAADKKDVVSELKKLVKDADRVWLCSDADREGEAIAWHCAQTLAIPESKQVRITFNEITEKGVRDGIKQPRKLDYDMIDAARTRSVLDRMVGYRISPMLWFTIHARSAGRCQSAGLKILADLERKIKAFVPEEFYEIKLSIKKDGKVYPCKFKGEVKDKYDNVKTEEEAKKILAELEKGEYIVKDITSSDKLVYPKPAFTTSTLQQTASTSLGMSPKSSMATLSDLFTDSHITYIRTDSTRLAPEFVEEAKAYIIKNYGEKYYSGYKEKVSEGAQNAHEAIRCTNLEAEVDNRLYRLIKARTLASLMVPAKVKTTTITIENGKYVFKLSGQTVLEEGFYKVYNHADEGDDENGPKLPNFIKGEICEVASINYEKNQTKPPQRFSEAGLISTLEKMGIGRPSTFASIVETLKEREYTVLQNKSIVVTDLGLKLSEFLDKYFPTIINVGFTADMETKLDEIANGALKRVETLTTFYDELKGVCNTAQKALNEEAAAKKAARVIVGTCPDCGKNLYEREGKYGKFIGCEGYPRCRYMRNADGSEVARKTVITDNLACPKCKKGHLVQRTNSKDQSIFWACSAYPKCKQTLNEEDYNKYKADGATVVAPTKANATKAPAKKTTTKKSTAKKTTAKKSTTKKTSTKKKTK